MSDEPQPIEAEVVSIEPKAPRFDLRNAKPPTFNESVTQIMSLTGLERNCAEGLLSDLIMRKTTKEGQLKIANRWGVAFGDVTRCYHMGKVTIEDSRQMMGTKNILIANQALDRIQDKLNDPEQEVSMKELITLSKSATDNALNLENKGVGPTTTTNINVGDVAILIQHKAERDKQGGSDAMARLLAKGINPELIEKAKG